MSGKGESFFCFIWLHTVCHLFWGFLRPKALVSSVFSYNFCNLPTSLFTIFISFCALSFFQVAYYISLSIIAFAASHITAGVTSPLSLFWRKPFRACWTLSLNLLCQARNYLISIMFSPFPLMLMLCSMITQTYWFNFTFLHSCYAVFKNEKVA